MKLKMWFRAVAITASMSILIAGQQKVGAMSEKNLGLETGLKLFQQICSESPEEKNALISPHSAYYAVSMLTNGASGETEKQLLEFLNESGGVNELNSKNQNRLASIKKINSAIALESANALYIEKKFHLLESFKTTCIKYYGAEIHSADFSNSSTVDEINGWCAKKTHDKIKSIISQLNPNQLMVLLNALYFKGTWDQPFKKEHTSPSPFHTIDGKSVDVDLMNETDSFNYLKGDTFVSVELPYKRHDVSMYVFLPNSGVPLKSFRNELTAANWTQWMHSYQFERTHVGLPKFKVEYAKTLNTSMQSMGVKDAFDLKTANFSKIVAPPNRLAVSTVIQKTYMDVNEQGTEAAAVTAIMMAGSGMPRQGPKEFVVDRPFVLAIVNNGTKEILFLGQITNPKSTK